MVRSIVERVMYFLLNQSDEKTTQTVALTGIATIKEIHALSTWTKVKIKKTIAATKYESRAETVVINMRFFLL